MTLRPLDTIINAERTVEGGGFVVGPTDGSAPSVSFGDPEFDPYLNWYYSSAWATSSRSSEPAVAPDATTTDSAESSDSATPTTFVEVPEEMKRPENLPTKDEAQERAKSIMDEAGVDVRDDDIEVWVRPGRQGSNRACVRRRFGGDLAVARG
ncbi:MAG: hypothetical protein EBW98_04530 [Actinobacteria bacterium]|nr:hypothetical protein [Actinomycetota bacterium]